MDFDVISYLKIHTDPQVKKLLSLKMSGLLAQYIIIRTIELLEENQLKDINHPKQLFEQAQKDFPDFNQKLKEFIIDFKNKYHAQIGES